jgi:biopolymer transport protein ExbD
MAEVNTGGGGGGKGKGGKVRGKKQSTKIDMTPMVDLAFLLLTFFMLTTTFSKPQTMEIVMPDKEKVEEENQTKVKASQAMTLVLSEGDKIYYYYGSDDAGTPPELQVTNFSKDGIRKVLIQRLQQQPKTFVLIKAQDKAKYKNMVDILDEMNITNVETYAIIDYTPEDEEFMKQALAATTES